MSGSEGAVSGLGAPRRGSASASLQIPRDECVGVKDLGFFCLENDEHRGQMGRSSLGCSSKRLLEESSLESEAAVPLWKGQVRLGPRWRQRGLG